MNEELNRLKQLVAARKQDKMVAITRLIQRRLAAFNPLLPCDPDVV